MSRKLNNGGHFPLVIKQVLQPVDQDLQLLGRDEHERMARSCRCRITVWLAFIDVGGDPAAIEHEIAMLPPPLGLSVRVDPVEQFAFKRMGSCVRREGI